MRSAPYTTFSSESSRPSRSAASCAECKRLKIRCNKQVPCDSCLRRGCGAICPDGTISTGDGHRAFWASTQQLRSKLSHLAARIKDLEDALRELSSKHPLLDAKCRSLKEPFMTGDPRTDSVSTNAGEDRSRALSPCCDQVTHRSLHTALPLIHSSPLSLCFGQTSASDSLGAQFHTELPTQEDARELAQSYYDNVGWMYNPVSSHEFDTDVLQVIYHSSSSERPSSAPSWYTLAILFMVLAIGSVAGSGSTSSSAGACGRNYYHNACRLMNSNPIWEQPSLEVLQVLMLMNIYLCYRGPSIKNTNLAWVLSGVAVKLAEAMGLHHDPSRLGLSPLDTRKRCRILAELYMGDSFLACGLSRPPVLSATHCNLSYEAPLDEDPYFAWKYSFMTNCITKVQDISFRTFDISEYPTILELDHLVRQHPMPPMPHDQRTPSRPLLQATLARIIQHRLLLLLHYSSFHHATTDAKLVPLSSRFANSIRAAYDSALDLVHFIGRVLEAANGPISQHCFFWKTLVAATAVIGGTLSRCPEIFSAQKGLSALGVAEELFTDIDDTAAIEAKILIARFRTHASQRASNMSQAVPDLSCLPTDSAKQDLFSCKATNEALAWEDIFDDTTGMIITVDPWDALVDEVSNDWTG